MRSPQNVFMTEPTDRPTIIANIANTMAMSSSNSLLDVPDLSEALPLSDNATWWTNALNVLPFLHSFFWLLFFVLVAYWRKPEVGLFPPNDELATSSNIFKLIYEFNIRIISLWMMYGLLKFAMIMTCAFVGLNKIKTYINVTDWRSLSLSEQNAAKENETNTEQSQARRYCSVVNCCKKPNNLCLHDADAGAGHRSSNNSPNIKDGEVDITSTTSGDNHSDIIGRNAANQLHFDSVTHVVVIPNYSEPASTLARTLDTLQDQSISHNIVVVLAMESRDQKAHETAAILISEYSQHFKLVFYTVHELKEGEVGGKSSNENWAVRCTKTKLVDQLGMSPDRIVVTVCDADTYFHPHHFACLSYKFVTDKNRYQKFWQACACFYPNMEEVPLLCRIRYTMISIGFLGQLVNPCQYSLPFSVYSLSLKLAIQSAFWDPSVIPEDWHMYLRCFYATKCHLSVEPIFLPVGCECIATGDGVIADITACYKQSQRWQWGAVDVGYIIVNNIISDNGGKWANIGSKLAILLTACEHHLLYNVMWCALVLSPFIFANDLGGWKFIPWPLFLFCNWLVIFALDSMYRQIISGRRHFGSQNILLQQEPSISSSPLTKQSPMYYQSVNVEEEEFKEKVGENDMRKQVAGNSSGQLSSSPPDSRFYSFFVLLGHGLSFLCSPLSDFFLFVIPTFHAHVTMAFSSNFVYIVAPKGKDTFVVTNPITNSYENNMVTGNAGSSGSLKKVHPQYMSVISPQTNQTERSLLVNKQQEMKTYG